MLNKILGANAKKIRSAPKPLVLLAAATILLIVAVLAFKSSDRGVEVVDSSACKEGLLTFSSCITLERAETDETRSRGLSGRDPLPEDQAMLFVFDQADKRCFWMKDMKFNLDLVWTDASKKVVRIDKDLSPATYPESFCSENTQYVFEFTAGGVEKYGITTGQNLLFK